LRFAPDRSHDDALTENAAPGKARPWPAATAIVALALVAYLPALRCGFVWDDDHHFVGFPMIVDPNGLWRIWVKHEFYYPLTSTVWWVAWRLWGANPFPYHLMNVVLHGLNAALFWRVLRRLRIPGAWVAAAAFAVHPVAVQSVAWATELKNCLSTLFYLASLMGWLMWLQARRDGKPGEDGHGEAGRGGKQDKGAPWLYWASLACFALAVAAKTPAIVLAPALALATLRLGVRWDRRLWAAWAPFWGVVAFSGWVTVQGQVIMTGGPTWSQPLSQRIPLAARAFWFYLGKLAWPAHLSFVYTLWPETAMGRSPSWLPVVAMVGLFVGLATLAGLGRGAWRVAGRATLLAALYYVVALSPALGFFKMYYNRYSWVADHWQYLAMMGGLAWGVGGATWLGRRLIPPKDLRSGLVAWVAGAALLTTLGSLTMAQSRVYRDSVTLWLDVLDHNPTAVIAYEQLGVVCARQGRLADAERSLRAGLRLAPDDPELKTVLGGVLASERRWPEANRLFKDAARALPGDFEIWNNLGSTELRMGHPGAAIEAYRKALDLAHGDAGVIVNYATALAAAGRREDALAAVNAALRRAPANAKLRDLRAFLMNSAPPAGH
jgi:tetratricopeptide (TPR) repeat protein